MQTICKCLKPVADPRLWLAIAWLADNGTYVSVTQSGCYGLSTRRVHIVYLGLIHVRNCNKSPARKLEVTNSRGILYPLKPQL